MPIRTCEVTIVPTALFAAIGLVSRCGDNGFPDAGGWRLLEWYLPLLVMLL